MSLSIVQTVGVGTDTITLTDPVPVSSPTRKVSLYVFGVGDGGLTDGYITDDQGDDILCYTDCGIPADQQIWKPNGNLSINQSTFGVFCIRHLVLKPLPIGTVLTINASIGAATNVQSVAQLVYDDALPGAFMTDTDPLNTPPVDDCDGAYREGTLTVGTSGNKAILGFAFASYRTECKTDIAAYSLFSLTEVFDFGDPNWTLSTFSGGDFDVSESYTYECPTGVFNPGTLDSHVEFGYADLVGPDSYLLSSQWNCPGHGTFGGVDFYNSVLFGATRATYIDEEIGLPYCSGCVPADLYGISGSAGDPAP